MAGADFETQFFADANDTTFVDIGLNTVSNAYIYKLTFFVNGESQPLGETNVAASVFLNTNPTDEAINLSWEEKFELDVQYVDTQSLWLDFKIMFKTAEVMLKKEGINAPDQAVGASRFTGSRDN